MPDDDSDPAGTTATRHKAARNQSHSYVSLNMQLFNEALEDVIVPVVIRI